MAPFVVQWISCLLLFVAFLLLLLLLMMSLSLFSSSCFVVCWMRVAVVRCAQSNYSPIIISMRCSKVRVHGPSKLAPAHLDSLRSFLSPLCFSRCLLNYQSNIVMLVSNWTVLLPSASLRPYYALLKLHLSSFIQNYSISLSTSLPHLSNWSLNLAPKFNARVYINNELQHLAFSKPHIISPLPFLSLLFSPR